MSTVIRVKRSAVPGKIPTTGSMIVGEIAVNTYNGLLYIRGNGGTDFVKQIGLLFDDPAPKLKTHLDANDFRVNNLIDPVAVDDAATKAYVDSFAERVALFVDQKTQNTDGGTFTNGAWRTRDLNTSRYNNIPGCSLASNRVTLAAGNYVIIAEAPHTLVGAVQARLWNITTNSLICQGSSEVHIGGGLFSGPLSGRSSIYHHLTLTGSTQIELQHKCATTVNTTGFGQATNQGGEEVYSRMLIIKKTYP